MDERTAYGRKISVEPRRSEFDASIASFGPVCSFVYDETKEGWEFWASLSRKDPEYASAIASLRARAYKE